MNVEIIIIIKKTFPCGFPLCFYLRLHFHSEALKVKLTHSFSHIWVAAFYWASVIVLFFVHCRVVTDHSCMREEEALHASVICSAVTICRWRHRSRLPLHQLLPALFPLTCSSCLCSSPSKSYTHVRVHICCTVFYHFLSQTPSYLSPPPCSLVLLYLLPDWLSFGRWMCAFPGQMALLLLRVPGSHFNTRPPCLAWRAVAWGEDSTFTASSKCVLWSEPHGCFHFFLRE